MASPAPSASVLQSEPVTIMAAINAAIGSTIGILTLTETIAPEVGGAIAAALGAWILVGALLFVRRSVTPNPFVEERVQTALFTPVPKTAPPKPQ
jgi:hypothetical protein